VDKVSKHITYAEATKSQIAVRFGLDNTPTVEQFLCMKDTANEIFEKVREHFDVPIAVSSFFRSEKVNEKAGGSSTSDHLTGRSIDMDADVFGGVTNREIFEFIRDNFVFDQLIWEFGSNKNPDWVHASFRRGSNRMEIKRATREGKKTKYTPYK